MSMDLSRCQALLGAMTMHRLETLKVAIVGIGGVGSWCAEALVRTGVRHLTLIDDDLVQPSNLNRQCPATAATIGRPKVFAMRERLLAINPDAAITAINARYPAALKGATLSDFDFIVDAIDSVADKAELILTATEAGIAIVSSLGAALRLDPTCVTVRRFDRAEGDALARALRQRFKRLGRFPAAKFNCVVSTECPQSAAKAGGKGSLMPVTCAFGMALAAEVLREAANYRGKDQGSQ